MPTLLALTACGGSRSTLQVVPNATLRLAQAGDVPTLDPAAWSDADSYIYMRAIYDTLVAFSGMDARVVPDLATHWRVEDGGRVYVFYLRRHVRFSNGDPLTAAAVRYNLERVTSSAAGAPYADAYEDIVGYHAWHTGHAADLAGVSTRGPDQLVIRLSHPEAYFLDTLALMSAAVGDPRIEARYGFAHYSLHAVGSGPYRVALWRRQEVLVLTRNPYYWGRRPPIAKVVTTVGPDAAQALLLFEKGRIDYLPLTPSTALAAMASPSLLRDERRGVASSLYYVGINTARPPLTSVMLRRALNFAVNRSLLVADVLYGMGRPDNDGFFTPTMPGYAPKARLPYPYDPSRARAILQRYGYTPTHPLVLTDVFYGDGPDVRLADVLRVELAAVGVRLMPEPLDWASFTAAISNPNDAFNLFQLGWTEDYPDPQDFFANLLGAGAFGNTNDTYWSDAAFQRLLARADDLPATPARLQLFRRLNRMAVAAAPVIFLYYSWNEALVKPDLWAPNPADLGLGPVAPITFQALRVVRRAH